MEARVDKEEENEEEEEDTKKKRINKKLTYCQGMLSNT